MKISFNYIYNLLKLAAKDIPDFYPEWVKEHPKLKQYESLSDIKTDIPIEDYREPVVVDLDSFKSYDPFLLEKVRILTSEMSTRLSRIVSSLINEKDNLQIKLQGKSFKSEEEADDIKQKINLYSVFIDLIGRMISQFIRNDYRTLIANRLKETRKMSSITLMEPLESYLFMVKDNGIYRRRSIKCEGNVNVFKMIPNLIDQLFKLLGESNITLAQETSLFKEIAEEDAYKDLNFFISNHMKQSESLTPNDFEIVFSKERKDILSMSIRSQWASCQSLIKEKDFYNVRAIHSAVSPYVGIIYLTNKKDYKTRGEEMVARSLVFLLKKKTKNKIDSNEYIINVHSVYSNYNKAYIEKMFVESLQKHSPIKVCNSDIIYSGGYYFPIGENMETEEVTSSYFPGMAPITKELKIHPYFDVGIDTEDKYPDQLEEEEWDI